MLRDKVVLVSGGTGTIGSAVVRVAAAHGADVAFTFHVHEARARELAAEVERLGRKVMAGRVEALDARSVEEFVGEVEKARGRVDVLVNGIGVIELMPLALTDGADWDAIIGLNLKSMFHFARAVTRGMIRRRAGSIVNLGSVAGHRLLEVPVTYATAKAGVSGFTLGLARELCRYGIRVNEVAPGLIEGGVGAEASERQRSQLSDVCALARPGKPEEVAEVVAFLASDRASYVNAQTIAVDGGL